jgi:hypothetical protein
VDNILQATDNYGIFSFNVVFVHYFLRINDSYMTHLRHLFSQAPAKPKTDPTRRYVMLKNKKTRPTAGLSKLS